MRQCSERVPHARRLWRLETELKEDGVISESESEVEDETGVESESEGSEETHWGTDESEESEETHWGTYESEEEPESVDSDNWDNERDWYLENRALGSLLQ